MRIHHRFYWGTQEYAQVVILECGSKSTPLIAGVCRELGVCTHTMHPGDLVRYAGDEHIPKAIFISGGPDSVYDPAALQIPYELLMHLNYKHGTRIFTICYGAQAFVQRAGGTVVKSDRPEVGIAKLTVSAGHGRYEGGPVVMNHTDAITALPDG